MQLDAFGRLIDIDAPETVSCSACHGRAERIASAWQGDGTAHHHYHCQREDCPAGGTLVEHKSERDRRTGPVFADRDLAVRLATRDHSETTAETREVRA